MLQLGIERTIAPPVRHSLHGRCVVCGPAPVEIVCDADDLAAQRTRLETFLQARSGKARSRRRNGEDTDIPAVLVACTRCGLLFHIPSLEGKQIPDPARTRPEVHPPGAMVRSLLRMAPNVGKVLTVGSSPSGGFDVALAQDPEALVREDDHAQAISYCGREAAAVKRTLEELGCQEARASVDAVLMWSGFEDLSEPGRMFHAAAHMLRPGGWFAVRLPHGGCFRALVPLLEEPSAPGADFAELCLAWNHLLGFPYHYGHSLQSLDALAQDAGFARRAVFGGTAGPLADAGAPIWARAEERALKRAQREWVRLEQRQLDPSLAAAPWLEVYYRHAPSLGASPRSV